MTIPAGIRKPGPYIELDDTGLSQGLPSNLQEMLIIAQKTAAGTATVNVPVRVYSAEEAATLFGPGSIAHRMVIAAFLQNPYARLSVVPVADNGSGVPATSTVTFTGPATADGTCSLSIGTDTVSIVISDDDTATEIAAAMMAAVNANTNLPVTANNNSSAILTLTAKNDGSCGNLLGRYSATDTGWLPEVDLDCAGVTAAVTKFVNGATDSSLTNAFAAVLPYRYHQIAFPFIDAVNVGLLGDYLDLVSDYRNMRGARGYIFMTGALASATTIAEENNKRLHLGYIRKCARFSFENAAAYAAMQNAESNLALPLNNAELVGCDAPAIEDRFTDPTEVEALLNAGVTPFVVGAGEAVQCVRAITTYTEDATGNASSRWLDSSKIGIADYVRDAIKARHQNDYANAVIKDEHGEDDPDFLVTPDDINSTNIDVMKRIEKLGYVENVDANIDLFSVERDESDDTRVVSTIPMNPVDPVMVLATTLKVLS
jgi:phage tail sheath gpL-like